MSEINNKTSEIMTVTRRCFLKKVGLATLPATGVMALGQKNLIGGENVAKLVESTFIRLRERAGGEGWKYLRIRSVNRYYPKQEDEKEFVPGKFGGDAGTKLAATGAFRTERVGKRWWLVDPEGHPFVSCGVNAIREGRSEQMRNAIKAGGGPKTWSQSTVSMLKQHGINTAGSWSTAEINTQGQIPHAELAYVFSDFSEKDDPLFRDGRRPYGLMECFSARIAGDSEPLRGGVFAAFHPDFEAFCERRCRVAAKAANDPWLLGYFSDNELQLGSLSTWLGRNIDDAMYGPGAREAKRWLAERKKDASQINHVDGKEWQAHIYAWYLNITTSALKKMDQKHLMLGTRFYARERNNDLLFAAAGQYLDVISINPYGMNSVPLGRMREWSRWAGGKPIIIGEFYVKGADVKTGNLGGAGALVATQEERGLYYQNFVLRCIESEVCVGWHWHQYSDVLDEVGASRGANKGVVTNDLQVYEKLLVRMAEANLRLHEIARRVSAV